MSSISNMLLAVACLLCICDCFGSLPVTLQAAMNEFRPQGFSAQWIDGDAYTVRNARGGVDLVNAAGTTVEFFAAPVWRNGSNAIVSLEYSSYTVSSDKTMVLFAGPKEKIWRHSYTTTYYIADIRGAAAGAPEAFALAPTLGPQRFAEWSPEGNRVAFVFQGNVYVRTIVADDISTSAATACTTSDADCVQVTTTSDATSPDCTSATIVHGVPDWVYEEEVFATAATMWWSPKGQYLSFASFNDSSVGVASISYYQGSDTLATRVEYRYPTPGKPAPLASVSIYDSSTGDVTLLPLTGVNAFIVGSITWASDEDVAVRTQNRIQSSDRIVLFTVPTMAERVVYAHTVSNGWADLSPVPKYIDDKLLLMPTQLRDVTQLGLYDLVTSSFVQVLETPEVTSIDGFGAECQCVVFSTTDSPTRRTVWKSTLTNGKLGAPVQVSTRSGMHWASMAPLGKVLELHYTGPEVPQVTLVGLTDSLHRVVVDNLALQTKMLDYDMPTKEFSTITTESGLQLQSVMIKPANFVGDGSVKYPVLFKVYGGPGSQGVTESFSVYFDDYVAATGVIVCQVDGRGTAAQGTSWLHMSYRRLGQLEPQDQIAAAAAVGKYDYVDSDRLAIWGWSYGGFVTSRIAVTDSQQVFALKIAVAPVTDWRYYDSIYTERYMGLPENNQQGYDAAAVAPLAANVQPSMLLIHGLADDNVHFLNSAMFYEAILAADKDITTHFYPNRDHSIAYGPHIRESVYELVVAHMREVFGLEPLSPGQVDPIHVHSDRKNPANFTISPTGPIVVAILFIIAMVAIVVRLLVLLRLDGRPQ